MKKTNLIIPFSLLFIFQKTIPSGTSVANKSQFSLLYFKHQYTARTKPQELLKTRANKALFDLHRQHATTYNWQRELFMHNESDKQNYTVFDYIAAGNYEIAQLMFENACRNVSQVRSSVMQEIYTATAQLFESASKAPHSLSFDAVSQQCIETERLYKKYPQYKDYLPFFTHAAEFFIRKERDMLFQKQIVHQPFLINE